MLNSNFTSFLFGPTRHRERRETLRAFRRTERAWQHSPLAGKDLDELAERLAAEVIGEQHLLSRVRAAATDAVRVLLLWEDIGELQVDWSTIDADPIAAIGFRQMLARRRRWARDPLGNLKALSRTLGSGIAALIEAVPESCLHEDEPAGAIFDVPLVELIDHPARVIERHVFAPYEGDCLGRELFCRVRQILERNLVTASGLPPTADIRGHVHKLVIPTRQKDKSAAQLADLYLAGTPWQRFLNTPVPFHVPDDIRYEHAAIVAGTGHGKTQLLQRLIHADLVTAQQERRSVVVIDSQGDLINRLVRLSLFSPDQPDGLADRLVLIDPSDVEYPPALNLFEAHAERLRGYRAVDRERVLNGVVELYETFFADLLGAELTQKQGVVFKYLARLMLTIPGATIHTLMELMEDGGRFRQHMEQLEGSARQFFATEFFHPAFAATKKQILRRLWGVLSTPSFERMFSQSANKLDVFQALQDGSILLINTAKDLLKTEGSQLFGRFFIKLIAQAALERSTIDPADRTPTMVYVDEAQEYFDDTTETILNQARKYKVGITTAFQTLDMMSPRLRAVMLADTSIKCAGGVSARDARALAEELHTTAEFIGGMRRRPGRTEFAVWVKNRTPHAIRLPVPLGYLEQQPILAEAEFATLINRNRSRYCGKLVDEALQDSIVARDQSREDSPVRRRAPTTTPRPPLRSDATEAGKGGSQHKYLQQLIKQLAEERGLRAVVEEAVPGGQVDVGLHRGDLSIACEISITSTPEYEAQNLAKCLRAGFTRIWAIAPDVKRRRAIQVRAETRLGSADAERIEFYTTEEMIETLDALLVPEPEEKIVKGYRVKSTRKAISPAEAKARRANIARILSHSLRERDR